MRRVLVLFALTLIAADAPRPIQFPAPRAGTNETAKVAPQKLSKGTRYVLAWHSPFVVDFVSGDGGSVSLVERKGPRPYATEKTICAQSADADNPDITTIADAYIVEVVAENSGTIYLEAFPALKQDKDGKAAPLAREDVTRRVLVVEGAMPAPVDETTDAVRRAYNSERDPEALRQLVTFYRESGPRADAAKTWGEFFKMMSKERDRLMGDKLPATREALGGAVFDKRWPNKMDAAMDARLAKDGLAQAVKVLEALK